MQRLLVLLFALAFAATAQAGSQLLAPRVVKVNDRIHALLGPMELPNRKNQGYMVNSTLIIGDTGAIVVDTGFTDEIGAHLARQVARLTSKPVTTVINTHHHGDHSFGNTAFPGATVISSEMCRQLLVEGEAVWLDIIQNAVGRKFPNTRAVPASQVYARNTRTEITIDGVRMVLWVPEAAHTLGDLMIWLPDDQVLLAGDILVNEITPNFRDANVAEWIKALEEIGRLPARTIIPGHGPLMKPADAVAMRDRMAKLYAGIQEGYKEGLTDSEIRARLDLGAWKKLRHFNEQMGGNINRAYLEVEAAAF